MITTDGKVHIKRYLAGFVPYIAQSIAFGLGGGTEVVGDTRLNLEVGREEIFLTTYDFVNNKLIFKAALPEDFSGTIYETALFSQASNATAGEFGSTIITTFDSDSEAWLVGGVAATFSPTNARIGGDSLRLTPAVSASSTASLGELVLDFSGYSGADQFLFALNASTNVGAVSVKFLTDASNYYTFNLGAQTAGYKILTANKSTAVVTGTPNWASITEIQVTSTSTAGGASTVDFDAIRIEDTDTINEDYVMVSRELLATPFVKEQGKVQEIEFALDVSV